MGFRSRLAGVARAWLACAALFVAMPAVSASADARPTAACIAVECAPKREALRDVARRAAPLIALEAPRPSAAVPVSELPAPSTQAPRVRVPRLYLRLLSIRC